MINPKASHVRLPMTVPEGQLVDRNWLKKQGFTRPDIDYYLRSGALQAVSHGVYRKPGKPLKWEEFLYSLQAMEYNVHCGGPQAIAEQGYSHFVSMSKVAEVHLYSPTQLPAWLQHWGPNALASESSFYLHIHRQTWLKELPQEFFTYRQYGHWDWQLRLAQIELAVFECLFEMQSETDFQQMDRWFESLSSLSPVKLQKLLKLCPSVKTKRLFGWFAERHAHAWLKHLDWASVDLGRGKRSVVKGGSYNKQWQITVPRKMEVPDGSEQSIF